MLSLVEMGQIVDRFTPNATTQQNSLVESDLLVRTRLKAGVERQHFVSTLKMNAKSKNNRTKYVKQVCKMNMIKNKLPMC